MSSLVELPRRIADRLRTLTGRKVTVRLDPEAAADLAVCDKCGRTAKKQYGVMFPGGWIRFEKDGLWLTYCSRCAQLGFKPVRR